MNLSGRAFKYYFDKEKIDLPSTITVVDDIALPITRLRLRGGGSAAGHNGLKDIEAILGTDQYPKLRFGIGNNYPKGMQVEYVLGKWNQEELPLVKSKIERSVDTIESFAVAGLERTMNLINNWTVV